MSMKVKRGLGLLVVAVAAWLVGLVAMQSTAVPATVLLGLASVVAVCALVAGVVLLAWGLLRE